MDDDKVWLTYWLVYGLAVVLDGYARFLLDVIPHYYILKLAFFVWLQWPGRIMGASLIYNWILAPLHTVIGPTLNSMLNSTKEDLYNYEKSVKNNLTKIDMTSGAEFALKA